MITNWLNVAILIMYLYESILGAYALSEGPLKKRLKN